MFDCAVSLAGLCADIDGARRLSALSDVLIAADGGADTLLKGGIKPDWVIGDNDSAQMSLPEKTIQLLFPEDKDFTDGELAISLALFLAESNGKIKTKDSLLKAFSTDDLEKTDPDKATERFAQSLTNNFRQAKNISDLSFLILFPFGKRIDHSWTNVLLAASLARSGALVYLSDGLSLARIIAGKLSLQAVFATEVLVVSSTLEQSDLVFSAIPLDDEVQGFTLKGLKWELDQTELDYNKTTAVSNRPRDGEIADPYVSLEEGTVMLLLTAAD